jgi:His-Xaa-Ser system protein HxsD
VPKIRALTVDLAVYSLDCVKRSAYRFTDSFALDLKVESNSALCTLSFDAKASDQVMDQVVASFRKELLDQDLRATIRVETKEVRNLILAHAFSRTGLIGDEPIPVD